MSMIRAQEYFAPLRSRHISLQQWERGQLFESWGCRGGRPAKQRSVDLDYGPLSPDTDELDIVRSRSLSVSRSLGKEAKAKFFSSASSFSRSLQSSGEILVGGSSGPARRPESKSSTDCPRIRSKALSGLLFSRSFQRRRMRSEVSGTSQSAVGSPADARSRAKKFFSGGLSFSKETKAFSRILTSSKSFGVASHSLQSLRAENISSPDWTNEASLDTNQDAGLKKNDLVTRVLSFSKSLNPREEILSLVRGISLSFKITDRFQEKKTLARGLSFSGSSDSTSGCSTSLDEKARSECLTSLNVNGTESGPKKLIRTRTGFFFPRLSSQIRKEIASESYDGKRCTDKTSKAEGRSKRFGGRWRNFSFSRILDAGTDESLSTSNSDPSAETGRSEKDNEILTKFQNFKKFITRGIFSARCLVPGGRIPSRDSSPSPSVRETSDGRIWTLSRKFFSREWSWSHSTDMCSQAPILNINSPTVDRKSSSPTVSKDFPRNVSSFNGRSSPKSSHALKQWWLKRSRSVNTPSSQSVVESQGIEHSSKLVLLEKVPAPEDPEAEDDLTVYVGERGSTLTKYVLTNRVLRHHLFQVLLKCSKDELGSDHDYNSGVPIICDPALFLQVARAVGGNCAAQA